MFLPNTHSSFQHSHFSWSIIDMVQQAHFMALHAHALLTSTRSLQHHNYCKTCYLFAFDTIMTSAILLQAAFVAATYVTSCGAFLITPVHVASMVKLHHSESVIRSYSNLGLLHGITIPPACTLKTRIKHLELRACRRHHRRMPLFNNAAIAASFETTPDLTQTRTITR
jgi:hypothetical protein